MNCFKLLISEQFGFQAKMESCEIHERCRHREQGVSVSL